MSVDASNASAAAGVDSLRARVTGAIKQAANSTGASFHYLLATAKMESDFNPTAGASTSSARGLYQFIEQTWLATVKEAGGTGRIRPICRCDHEDVVRRLCRGRSDRAPRYHEAAR